MNQVLKRHTNSNLGNGSMLENSDDDKDAKQMFSELKQKIRSIYKKQMRPRAEEMQDVLRLKPNAKRSSIAFNTYVPISRGSVAWVFGPNGSGKTRFLQSYFNELDVPERKIALGTRSIANWEPFVDEVYGCPSPCVNVVTRFIAEVDKIADEINSAEGKNFLIVIDSVTDIVEKVAVMLEKRGPCFAAGLRFDTLDLLNCICFLSGRHQNGNCVTIIGTLEKNERNRRQTIICEEMKRFCSAYITLCRPNSSFEQIGGLSIDYRNGDYGLYGYTENVDNARKVYYKVREQRKTNDYLNTLVNTTDAFFVKK